MMVVLSPCVFRDFLGSRALLGEERVAFFFSKRWGDGLLFACGRCSRNFSDSQDIC